VNLESAAVSGVLLQQCAWLPCPRVGQESGVIGGVSPRVRPLFAIPPARGESGLRPRTHTGSPRGDDATVFVLNSVHLKTEPPATGYSSQVKPISYLKANAAEVLSKIAEDRQPLVITQNGEAKAVLQDVASYEQTQETAGFAQTDCAGAAGHRGRPHAICR